MSILSIEVAMSNVVDGNVAKVIMTINNMSNMAMVVEVVGSYIEEANLVEI